MKALLPAAASVSVRFFRLLAGGWVAAWEEVCALG